MAGDLSSRFEEYLRQRQHLTPGESETGSQSLLQHVKLWERTSLSASQFADEAAAFFGMARASLRDMMSAEPLVGGFSHRFLREIVGFPCRLQSGETIFAVADPANAATRRAAQLVLGAAIEVRVASFEDIGVVLAQRLDDSGEGDGGQAASQLREDDIESLRDLASGAPVVRAVNDLLEKAMELRASDIHIEPFAAGITVRMRIDGLLRQLTAPAGVPPQALISRIKIMASLNIAERRLPQDGAARVRAGRSEIDIRVAIMPTQHGESAVIRLLPKDRGMLVVDKLGFRPDDEARLRRLLSLPHGLVIITGPTGSGKTTTLATILSILNEPVRKILTVEDPIEYEIAGINQSQIKPAIGLTFASALRSFVRQDPDVIMVGEVRDTETAHVVVHAALTGHLVLSTLHTETAAAAVPRLLDLGVEGYLLRSVLRGVIAQRLVRQLCGHCKTPKMLEASDLADDPRLAALGLAAGEVIQMPCGCERCNATGYRGRIGVFEILELSSEIRELIGDRTDGHRIDEVAVRNGMTTMLQDGIAKCRAGLTSPAEILRVTTLR